jgi:hypothetical protein
MNYSKKEKKETSFVSVFFMDIAAFWPILLI